MDLRKFELPLLADLLLCFQSYLFFSKKNRVGKGGVEHHKGAPGLELSLTSPRALPPTVGEGTRHKTLDGEVKVKTSIREQ